MNCKIIGLPNYKTYSGNSDSCIMKKIVPLTPAKNSYWAAGELVFGKEIEFFTSEKLNFFLWLSAKDPSMQPNRDFSREPDISVLTTPTFTTGFIMQVSGNFVLYLKKMQTASIY